ncbi:MAG: preprotein translocase subunit YajC [Chromatiales bacterium]
MNVFIADAHAQAAPATGGGAGMLELLPLLVLFAVFYFFLIRPQMKRQKEHRQMVETIAKGDEIVTNGGIAGRITDLSDSFLTLEIAKGVEVKVQKQAVGAILPKGTLKAD